LNCYFNNPSRQRKSILAGTGGVGSKSKAKPKESVASVAPLRMRFSVYQRLGYTGEGWFPDG